MSNKTILSFFLSVLCLVFGLSFGYKIGVIEGKDKMKPQAFKEGMHVGVTKTLDILSTIVRERAMECSKVTKITIARKVDTVSYYLSCKTIK